ncbi:aldo/keto reductase [Nocardia sp. NPDC088792]|uniref:aldo/keto reductase n=1 Tax=Nocardia sp. NPDC088792 TaxID=3364332 RepID=UPI0037FFEF1A
MSAVCLGTVNFGWSADRDTCWSVLDRFRAAGGNLVDTADVYTRQGAGIGTAETVVGQWMSARGNRDDLVVATKVGGRMFAEPTSGGLNRRHVLRAVEASLRRLGTDYIDLYQAHWADTHTPIEDTLAVMEDLITCGKVRYFGVSNFSPWRLTEAIHLGRHHGRDVVATYQAPYSLLQREEFERWYSPLAESYRLGVLAFSPLEAGLLTGKYQRGQPIPENTIRRAHLEPLLTERNFVILDTVREIAHELGCSATEISLAWLLAARPAVIAVASANSVDQLDQILASTALALDQVQLQHLDHVSGWPKPDRWEPGW